MEKNNNLMKGQGEDGEWITINGAHVFVEKGQTVKDAMNNTFNKKTQSTDKDTSYEVLNVSKTLDKKGKATTQNKKVADMYKENANPYKKFTVKETSNGYEISVENKQQSKVQTTLTEDKRKRYDELGRKVTANRAKMKTASPEEKSKLIVENHKLMSEMDAMWDEE